MTGSPYQCCYLGRSRKPAVMIMRTLLATAAAVAVPGCTQPPASSSEEPPALVLGDFVDDYGIEYSVREDLWVQHPGTRFRIQRWDATGRFLVAQNDSANPSDGNLWTRIDWVALDGKDEFAWAFCYASYQAASHEEAVTAPPTQRDTPRTGCQGYPFSRMRRAAPPGS